MALATGAAVAVGVVLLASDGPETPRPERPAGGSERQATGGGPELAAEVPRTHPRGAVADCSTRSEARFPGAFTDPANLVVGPLVLVGGAYTSARTVRQFGGNKFPALVRAGHRVTVELPRTARDIAGIGWGSRRGGLVRRVARHTVSFVACRSDEPSGSSVDGQPVTFWSGGVSADAPRCVPLRVYVDDEPGPRLVGLPLGRACPAQAGELSTTTPPARD